jgi:MFS family permease
LLFVLGIWVKQLTGSAGAAGAVFLVFAVPALLAPATGLLFDRFPRRWVMVVNDLASAELISALLTVSDQRDIWLIYVVTFGYGVSGQVYQAARGDLVHSMLRVDRLGDANGLLGSLHQGLRVVGPLIGAALFVKLGSSAVVILDVGTLLISAVLLGLLGVSDLKHEPVIGVAPRLLHEMVAGPADRDARDRCGRGRPTHVPGRPHHAPAAPHARSAPRPGVNGVRGDHEHPPTQCRSGSALY